MNILHISTALSWRGGEQQLANLIRESNAGVNNLVFCAKGSAIEKHCRDNSIPQFGFEMKGTAYAGAAFGLKRICHQNDISIIHCHDSNAHSMAFISALLQANKTPVVVHRRVDFPIQKGFFTRLKYKHASVKAYICVSEAIRNVLVSALKEQDKAYVVYSSVDLDKYPVKSSEVIDLKVELGLAKNHVLIGNTAALAPHKDYPTFLKTAKLLAERNPMIRFAIIGEGALRPQLEEMIGEYGLQGIVFMTGFREDVASLLPSLDVFLMTSKTEGLGSSILNAFATGVPVVATMAGGIPELVEEGQTGLLAKTGDASGLAVQVERLLSDEKLRKELIGGARKKVRQFSSESMARQTIEIYTKVLNKN